MKENTPVYTEKQIRNVLKICTDLGKITESQSNEIASMMNFQYQTQQCQKRNGKPLWERFASDFAALMEDYNLIIGLGSVRINVTFADDVANNWSFEVESHIDPETVRKWPGIYKRQVKACKMIEQMPMEERTIEKCEQLLNEARRGTGAFAKIR